MLQCEFCDYFLPLKDSSKGNSAVCEFAGAALANDAESVDYPCSIISYSDYINKFSAPDKQVKA